MNDHRAHVKIEFSIYGTTFEWDTSINYFPNDINGMDSRVVEFFVENYAEARAAWDRQNMIYEEATKRVQAERLERAELARLKTKYETDMQRIARPDDPPLPFRDARASGLDIEDTFDRSGDRPNWSGIYNAEGAGRIRATGPEGSVVWVNPTSAGEFSGTGINCRVCGHKVPMKAGDVVKHGDPRLCEHLGGPTSAQSEPDDEHSHGYWEKGDY